MCNLSEFSEFFSQGWQSNVQKYLVPKTLGGFEGSLLDYSKAIRFSSRHDGSTGWRLLIGATLNGAVAAFGTDEAVEKIFTNKDKSNKSVIVAGQTSPRAEVEIIGKEFQLSGKFKFGSGLKEANWVLCGFTHPTDGGHRLAIIPKNKVKVQGGWSTFGLSETDSVDYKIDPVMVTPEFTFLHDTVNPLRDCPTFRSGIATVMLAGHIGFAIGIAEQALVDITKLVSSERRSGKLIERDDFLIGYGRQQATLKSIISFAESCLSAADNSVKSQDLSQAHKDEIRIAAIHTTESARNIVRFIFDYAGMTSASKTSSLNRAFRDMHVASQHLLVNSSQYKPIVNRMIEALDDQQKS